MEYLTKIVAFITALISALAVVYKFGFKGEHERIEKYYDEVLCPFLTVYKKNAEINPISYFKPILKNSNDNVPKYIFYLMEQQDAEKLKKVLLYDYFDLYKNEDNSKARIFDGMVKIIHYTVFLMALLLVFLCSLFFANGVLVLVNESPLILKFFRNEVEYTEKWMIGMAYFVGSFFTVIFARMMMWCSRLLSIDRYTLKKKQICRNIEVRVKMYDKKHKKWYW